MSEGNDDDMLSCASCGIAGIDDIKLKECDACDFVRYCSDECQTKHKSDHEEACKKRAAELRDELLFKQPESTHRGDCPICCLPMPIDISKSTMMTCCSKVICNGCDYALQIREREASLKSSCPFCRKPTPKTFAQSEKQNMKRIKANDSAAIFREGGEQYSKGGYSRAIEYWKKAANLGYADAHHQLSFLYLKGQGVEKDWEEMMYHMEEAAIGGHPDARHNLGCAEYRNNNTERALKHFMIAAAQGNDGSLAWLREEFRNGVVSKEDLAAALRAHHAVVNATKSPQRETGEEYYRNMAKK